MWNKIILHVFAALFSGFTFWKMGDGTFALQLRLFAIFNFIFVAPGCINQMQPFFLHNRDIFETREKKVIPAAVLSSTLANRKQSKTYHWIAFIGAQAVSEIPYLIICATLYFACWYFVAGLPVDAYISGHMYLQMICAYPSFAELSRTDRFSLRIPVYIDRTGHCGIRTQRVLRRHHEPHPHRCGYDRFLWCCCALR